MKTIELNHGQVAIVDDADYEWAAQYKWRAIKDGRGVYHAVRTGRMLDGRRQTVTLGRVLLGVPRGINIRYLDGDALNCQRDNLFVSPGFKPDCEVRHLYD